MTKSQLIAQIQSRCPELGRRTVEDAVFLFFHEIAFALQNGCRVELRGFGSFCVRERGERVARNPRSGVTVRIPKRKMPFFKAGKAFRDFLNIPSLSEDVCVPRSRHAGSLRSSLGA